MKISEGSYLLYVSYALLLNTTVVAVVMVLVVVVAVNLVEQSAEWRPGVYY